MVVNDNYKNAVVGKIIEVADRSWGNPDKRMVVIETDDPFTRIVVRDFVKNWEDAQMLVDMTVCMYEGMVYRIAN
jgi:hypothetical protein